MNSTPNAASGFAVEGAAAPALVPRLRQFYWLLRRELWEYRSIYIAPLAAGAAAVVGSLVNWARLVARMPAGMLHAGASDAGAISRLIQQPFSLASLLIMLSTLLVAIFYSLGALNADRRDRSILFWKSLPVSDLMTVLSKASVPIVVLPLVTFGVTVATHWVMLLAGSGILLVSGQDAALFWSPFFLLPAWLGLLYHLVTVHGLCYAPFFGWMLLVSAWARRAPILWAFLPPLAIGIVEKMAFNTTHFGAMIANRMGGAGDGSSFTAGGMSMDPLAMLTPIHFLMSPGLWIGLAFTALCLAGAVARRRSAGPV